MKLEEQRIFRAVVFVNGRVFGRLRVVAEDAFDAKTIAIMWLERNNISEDSGVDIKITPTDKWVFTK